MIDVLTNSLHSLFIFGGDRPVHDLASARSHERLATCVPVQDVLSQGILCSSMTCGISGCSEEALHVTASWW